MLRICERKGEAQSAAEKKIGGGLGQNFIGWRAVGPQNPHLLLCSQSFNQGRDPLWGVHFPDTKYTYIMVLGCWAAGQLGICHLKKDHMELCQHGFSYVIISQ